MSGIAVQADLADLADQVARGLSKATMIEGRAFIRTAILFPSGSTVVVAIEPEGGGSYRVSDLGSGSDQAELLDIFSLYRGQAREVATHSGTTFTGHAFELARVTAEQLVGATMTVANAVGRALDHAVQRAEQRKREIAADRLFDRLGRLFRPSSVSRDVEIRGASAHAWKFDAIVQGSGHRAVFDIVTSHPTSIAFATTKFHDLARLDQAPVRVAVVHRKTSLHEFRSIVEQAAEVLDDDDTDQRWRLIAEAA